MTRSGDRKAREPHLPRVESSRQGARNVAGVTFQGLAACALLLMSSDVHAVVPEGTEDIDVVLAVGRILVQAKQRSSVLTLTQLADALARSAPSLASSPPGVRLAVVTDAPNLDGIATTGWSRTLESQQRVVETLTSRLGASTAWRVAESSHLVLIEPSLSSLAATLSDRRPSRLVFTSHLAAALLLARVQQRASANRAPDPVAPAHVRQDEVDELLLHAAAVEGQLLPIEEAGVVEPTRFRRQPRVTREEFLRGVRAQPWHIAAEYTVPRLDAFDELGSSLAANGAALIIGPSGSGKSTLMWQYAYATSGRCFTLNRLATDDVDRLGLFIDLMTPEGCAPVVVCADDVGASTFEGWPQLVGRCADDSRVVLIGTCREEVFSTLLTGGGRARIVAPILSRNEAQAIGRHLPSPQGARPRTPGDFHQLHDDARSLMMEFVHLATTNRHLEETLADQVAALHQGDNEIALEVLRLVAAADVGGAVLDRRELRAIEVTDAALSDALRRLQGEFLVAMDDERIGGLHALRSHYLIGALHEGLPTVAETFARLIGIVDAVAVADAVAAGFRASQSGQEFLERALAQRLQRDASLNSSALDTLLRAEAAAYARVLHAQPFAPATRTEMALLGKIAGRAAAAVLLMAPALPTSLLSEMWRTATDGIQQLDRDLQAMPDPRPVRRNVIELLSQDARIRMLASALQDAAGLSPLFGSDALDGDTATEAVALLEANLSHHELGEAIGRLARVGPRARAAVQQWCGGEDAAVKRVVDLLVPTIAIRAADDLLVADVLVPPGEGSQTVNTRLGQIADLAYSVTSNRQLLTLEAHDVEGEKIKLSGEQSNLRTTGNAECEWIARPVFSTYRQQYHLHHAEVTWSRWLMALADMADRSAADVETMVCAVIGFYSDAREGRDTRRWRRLARKVGRKSPNALSPPPQLTDEDPQALRELSTHLLQMAATTILLRDILVANVDEDVARIQRVFFDYCYADVPAIRQWLAIFADVSAGPATDRLFTAAQSAAWLTHGCLTDSNMLRRLVRNVTPTLREPRSAVAAVTANAQVFAEDILRVEHEALQPAVNAGWEIYKLPASYRGDALPISRWMLVSRNDTGTLDHPEVEALVDPRSTPTLDGRLLLLGGLPGGPVGDPILVWRIAGWDFAHPYDSGRVHRTLPSTSSPGPVLEMCTEVVTALAEVSKRAAAARLGHSDAELEAPLESVDPTIAVLPPAVQRHVRRLREVVEADIASGTAPSLALDHDRHLINPSYRSDVLDLIVAARAAAAREDAHQREVAADAGIARRKHK